MALSPVVTKRSDLRIRVDRNEGSSQLYVRKRADDWNHPASEAERMFAGLWETGRPNVAGHYPINKRAIPE